MRRRSQDSARGGARRGKNKSSMPMSTEPVQEGPFPLLLRGISHELNNLLAVTSGNVQLLQADAAASRLPALERLGACVESGQELSRKVRLITAVGEHPVVFTPIASLIDRLQSSFDLTTSEDCSKGQVRGTLDQLQAVLSLVLDLRGDSEAPQLTVSVRPSIDVSKIEHLGLNAGPIYQFSTRGEIALQQLTPAVASSGQATTMTFDLVCAAILAAQLGGVLARSQHTHSDGVFVLLLPEAEKQESS